MYDAAFFLCHFSSKCNSAVFADCHDLFIFFRIQLKIFSTVKNCLFHNFESVVSHIEAITFNCRCATLLLSMLRAYIYELASFNNAASLYDALLSSVVLDRVQYLSLIHSFFTVICYQIPPLTLSLLQTYNVIQ